LRDKYTLSINEEIDKATSKIIIDNLDNYLIVNRIILTSGGGDVKYSIPITNRIYDRKINIIIEKYAKSSAFNYSVLINLQLFSQLKQHFLGLGAHRHYSLLLLLKFAYQQLFKLPLSADF
jgi:hypothetical protein